MTLEIVRLGSGVGKRAAADPYYRVVSGKPRGFKGRWDMPTGMRKYYVVFDQQA